MQYHRGIQKNENKTSVKGKLRQIGIFFNTGIKIEIMKSL